MKTILKVVLLTGLLGNYIWGTTIDDPVGIGRISFLSAEWDNAYNIDISRNTISEHISRNEATVLFMFYACMS